MKSSRRRYEAKFKAEVALDAIKEVESIAQLAKRHDLHPVLISQWKKRLVEGAAAAFERGTEVDGSRQQDELLRKIGELIMERDFLAKGLRRSR